MKIVYVTLNNSDEARKVGLVLLKKKLANCVNFFPITCIYNYKNKITEEGEVVLIIKTIDKNYLAIKNLIKKIINYDNFIGQINVEKVNEGFQKWLSCVVK